VEFEPWAEGIFRARARCNGCEGISGGVPGLRPMQAVQNALYWLARAMYGAEEAQRLERA
jgi:hypothetical protein